MYVVAIFSLLTAVFAVPWGVPANAIDVVAAVQYDAVTGESVPVGTSY
jgi:hypothetical protein